MFLWAFTDQSRARRRHLLSLMRDNRLEAQAPFRLQSNLELESPAFRRQVPPLYRFLNLQMQCIAVHQRQAFGLNQDIHLALVFRLSPRRRQSNVGYIVTIRRAREWPLPFHPMTRWRRPLGFAFLLNRPIIGALLVSPQYDRQRAGDRYPATHP